MPPTGVGFNRIFFFLQQGSSIILFPGLHNQSSTMDLNETPWHEMVINKAGDREVRPFLKKAEALHLLLQPLDIFILLGADAFASLEVLQSFAQLPYFLEQREGKAGIRAGS